ncbi:MAG: hypothetical protein ACYCUY_05055 [Acidithiobacillus sp.]
MKKPGACPGFGMVVAGSLQQNNTLLGVSELWRWLLRAARQHRGSFSLQSGSDIPE